MTCVLRKAPSLYQAIIRKNITYGPITKLILARDCQHLTNRTDVRMQERLRLKDNISKDYRLIYREQNTIVRLIIATYYIGWTGILVSLSCMVYILYDKYVLRTPEQTVNNPNMWLSETTKPRSRLFYLYLSSIAMLGFILLVMYSKLLPFRIYHSHTQKLYKVLFVRDIFGRRKVTFAEGTAVPVFKRRMGDVFFRINDHHLILLDIESFPIPAYRERMINKLRT